MDLWENIALAVNGLLANKMRAVLTMLGIIIGIGSVIAIVTVGNSMTIAFAESMKEMGTNKIMVSVQEKNSNYEEGTGIFQEPQAEDLVTDEMIRQFSARYADTLESVSLMESVGSGKAQLGDKTVNVDIKGVNADYAKAEDKELLYGRFITPRDIEGKKYLAVVSESLASELFRGKSPIGEEIFVKVNNDVISFTIAGVYKKAAYMGGYIDTYVSGKDAPTDLFIPLSVAQKLKQKQGGYLSFSIVTKAGTDQNDFTEKTKSFFQPYYAKNESFGIYVENMQSFIKEMNNMNNTMTLAISAIAGISLLVGGIGVMNIMLVSITERTREIGTRKALGAQNWAIRLQFIVESIFICLIGGGIGILLGLGGGALGAKALGYPAAPSGGAVLAAVIFSMAIGVFFGYYPANKAAKMDPIDALRYE